MGNGVHIGAVGGMSVGSGKTGDSPPLEGSAATGDPLSKTGERPEGFRCGCDGVPSDGTETGDEVVTRTDGLPVGDETIGARVGSVATGAAVAVTGGIDDWVRVVGVGVGFWSSAGTTLGDGSGSVGVATGVSVGAEGDAMGAMVWEGEASAVGETVGAKGDAMGAVVWEGEAAVVG